MPDDQTTIEAARRSVDSSDPYLRERQTFPVLMDAQVARVQGYGSVATLAAGTSVFERGQRGVDFFLILDGSIEITDHTPEGDETVITTHGPRQFTGELDLFNRRKILVGGRTGSDSRLVRLTREQFRRMSSTEQDIGETIMRAFILRRTAFIVHSEAGVTLVGPKNDRDVIRINRFLTRNGYPLTLFEPGTAEGDRIAAQQAGAMPIVCTPDGQAVHNPTTPELADLLGLTEELDADHVYDLARPIHPKHTPVRC